VPYHLIGAESARRGGARWLREAGAELHPDASTPPVSATDAMLVDAQGWRTRLGDDGFIKALGEKAGDPDDWNGSSWTSASLDAAFAAPLVTGSAPADQRLARHDADDVPHFGTRRPGAFLPLENGLSVMSEHAHDLGYDAWCCSWTS